LLINEAAAAEEVLAVARVTLIGRVRQVAESEAAAIRDAYLARHPAARAWAQLSDFGLYRLVVGDVYYVAGFGAMGWVTAADYRAAAVDPLADHASGIIEHMNTDHNDAVLLYARVLAGVEADSASMVAVDRLGFQVRAQQGEQARTVRLAFPSEVRSTNDARLALIGLLKTARERTGT
jgi:putative heme iron utilization protein